jgi:cytochrome c553
LKPELGAGFQSSTNFGQETDMAGELAAIRGYAMVLLRHVAIAAAAWAGTCLAVLAEDQKPANAQDQNPPATQDHFVPRLNDMMVATQVRHFKLWYAGIVQNWPLANYELAQIRDAITDTERLFANKGGSKMSATMMPPTEDLSDAIKAKDEKKFASAFRKLTAACNSCHEATGFGFIKIRDPRLSPLETSPLSDESFNGK